MTTEYFDVGPITIGFDCVTRESFTNGSSTPEQLAADLRALTQQLVRVAEESRALLKRLAELEALLPKSPRVQGAFAALKTHVMLTDTLVRT